MIRLNDLLNISRDSDDYKYGRITFTTESTRLNQWLRRDDREDKFGPDFSFWAKSTNGTKTYIRGNEMVISTIQLDTNDTWLLVSICRITKINYDKPCEREPIEEYRKWFNRVIIKMKKRGQGYNFTIKSFMDRCEVLKVLEKEYGGKEFPGYNNVCEKMDTLINYLTNKNLGEDWKNKFKAVKAIYCLNNRDEGKVYIGSAYNRSGLFNRWQCYFENYHGGNVELKKMLEVKGEKYFLEHFYFSILEVFPTNTSDEDIIHRERHWMDVFNSTDPKQGYNH